MRAALMTAVVMLGLLTSCPVAAEPVAPSSATAPLWRRPIRPAARRRASSSPRGRPGATPYPLPGAAYPGPGYVRDCVPGWKRIRARAAR